MIFSRHPRKPERVKISVQGAYTLWRSLIDRYVFIEHFNLLKNFAHDQDFVMYLTSIITDFKNETMELEKICHRFSIPSPQPSSKDQNTAGNSEVADDKQTAEVLFRFLRLDLNILLLGLKNSYTNDEVKDYLLTLVKKEIERLDRYIPYLKAKNWIQAPPLYPYTNPEIKEPLAINEVYLLYDHLLYRYNNVHQTGNFAALTSDVDFRAILQMGIKILQKEIKVLEDKILYYGIKLPSPHPVNIPAPESQEILTDQFMFNVVFRGMQDAMVLHGTAISEIVVNDELRKLFIDMTYEELFMIDKMDKYGKLKGWATIVPSYRGGS